jgi:hypothetical protein
MTGFCRIAVDVPKSTATIVDRIAAERGVTRTSIVRHAISLLNATHEGAKEGLHAGLVRDKDKLDTLLVAPL